MKMDMTTKSCREFARTLASNAPAPGGAGAAAVAGALGTALGHMVGSLTVGKKKYRDVEEEMLALMGRCEELREQLLNQVQEDEENFLPLAQAYGIPKGDPDRTRILEAATVTACVTPVKIMELCCDAVDCIEEFARKGSRLAVSDAGCGAALCKAAAQAAALNVYINTKTMSDRAAAEELNRRTEALTKRCTEKADAVYAYVLEQLRV